MKQFLLFVALLCIGFFQNLSGQAITSEPSLPTVNDNITLTIDINACTNTSMLGYTGDAYVHIGLITSESSSNSDWKHVVTTWGVNSEEYKATRESENVYSYTISPDIRNFFGLANGETVQRIAIIIRKPDGSAQTEDLFAPVYEAGLNLDVYTPLSDTLIGKNQSITFSAGVQEIGTDMADSISLFINGELRHVSKYDTILHTISFSSPGTYPVKIVAENSTYAISDSIMVYCHGDVLVDDIPENLQDGINYVDNNTATLVLHAPNKSVVYVLGDFNQWQVNNDYLMNHSPDGNKWWITLNGLTEGEAYAFQYFIDGTIRVADPYSEEILDPDNDGSIPENTYPDLKAYPTGKTSGIIGVLQTGQNDYDWQTTSFEKPSKANLVIYEMHVQNFTDAGNIQTVTDTLDYLEKLGVNAIELMPVNEFEGNQSWGYNPSFYFAFDKMYGTRNDFKAFVDACHQRGIAVIMDMVLNHSYSQCPLVQMYWDGTNVTSDNPWYNVTCPHSNWCWGYDFDHESTATQYFVDRVNRYWLEEFHIDGFRFDFTKGFTNTNDANAWGPDESRIAILERMADSIWSSDNDAYVIFEHLTDNAEEKVLADYGILLWGNMNGAYAQGTMGYTDSGESDLSGISYTNRNWESPNLVGYMESHDEERLMYKNLTYGNEGSSGLDYDVKDLETALERIELAAAFFFTIPGPKMIWEFGELGYDYSINQCTDGSISDDCRLALKPIRWDYFDNTYRHELFKVYQSLIELKTQYEVTRTDDFSFSLYGPQKTLHLNSDTFDVTVIGNFDVNPAEITPNFQHTGTWYNYFTGEAHEVTDTQEKIELAAGGYAIFTSKNITENPLATSTQNQPTTKSKVFKLYPNPVSSNRQLHISCTNADDFQYMFVQISNSLGQIVYEDKKALLQSNHLTIKLPPLLPNGVYLYKIWTDDAEQTGNIILK